MIRIGDVWDSTTAVLQGRAGLLAPLAGLAFFLPSIGQSAVRLYGADTPGIAALGGLIGLLVLAVSIWGQLAIIAIASHPDTTRGDAQRLALRRLPANLLVLLVLGGIALLLVMPIVAVLVATGYDFTAAANDGTGAMPTVAPGALLFLTLYGLALLILGLVVTARLFLVNAVVLNERRGIGAIARSVALTRGLTGRLIGVALLFGIVLLVVLLAGQSVVGLGFRLILGPEHIANARFMAAIAGAAVTATFTTVVQVFAARLYAAIVARG